MVMVTAMVTTTATVITMETGMATAIVMVSGN
jgi:hypothetical protein